MVKDEKSAKLMRYVAVAVLTAAALLFSFFGITRSLWFDECCSIQISDASFGGILSNLKENAHTPPLYYFLLSLWMKLFGTGEAAARSLSALFYLLSIPALHVFGKMLFDRKTALLCAFLFLVNPMAVQFAQFARMYSLLSFLAILSTLFFMRLFHSGEASKGNWTGWMAVNVAGTFTHYWFFFLLLAQAAAYFLLFRNSSLKKLTAAMAVSVIPFFVLWTPTLLVQMANGGTSEIGRPGVYTLINTLLIYWGEGKKAALVYAAFLALVLVDLRGFRPGLQSLTRLKGFFLQKQTLSLVLLLGISLGIPWLISQFKPMYIETKYPMMVLFAVVMPAAAFLAKFGSRFLTAALCSALFLAVTTGLVVRRTHPPSVSTRSTTDYVRTHGKPGDVLVLSTSSLNPMSYYLKRAGMEEKFLRFPFPAEQALHPCWPNLTVWRNSKPALAAEAEGLLNRLDTLIQTTGGKVWFFDGHLPDIDGILKNKLDAYFQPVGDEALGQSYPPFREKIRVYELKNSTPPTR